MSGKLTIALIAAILFQGVVLTGMYVGAAWPEWSGTEIRVKTVPVDPRSLFRGNYARLRYDFDRLDRSEFSENPWLRNGEVVYVSLQKGQGGLYRYRSVSLRRPDDGIFLRGRIADRFHHGAEPGSYRLRFGIEAFFAPKEKALQLEKDLRDGGVAVLRVAGNGKARLVDVVGEPSLAP